MITFRSLTSVTLACALSLATSPLLADETSPECRGVAAGVVAAMRAAGDLTTDREVELAIVAARRACSAARQDLGAAPATDAGTAAAATGEQAKEEETSVWDLLTRDRELKPGNERLRRLKTQ